MTDLELMKRAIARTAAETELNSRERRLLERLMDHIAALESRRQG